MQETQTQTSNGTLEGRVSDGQIDQGQSAPAATQEQAGWTDGPDTSMLKVLLADDHKLVREALTQRIGREPDLEIVNAVADADEALRILCERDVNVAILDIEMPGRPVFEVAEYVAREKPNTAVLILSGFVRDHDLEQALSVGVRGFVAKSDPIHVLLEAVRLVGRGGNYFSPAICTRMSEGAPGGNPRVARTLTPREIEVMQHVAKGRTKKETADALSISVKTVESHVQNLMKKLDVHNSVELTRFAIREGFVRP